jgi:hypothetical protein
MHALTLGINKQFLFMVPLYFQAVRLESAGEAGTRLIVPSIGVPLGSTVAGYIMTHRGRMASLVRAGCFLLLIGVILPVTFGVDDADSQSWMYTVYLAPAAIGMGLFYPSALFSMLTSFEPGGESERLIYSLENNLRRVFFFF